MFYFTFIFQIVVMERTTREMIHTKKNPKPKNKNKNVDFRYYVNDIKMYFIKPWHGTFLLNGQNSFWNGQKVNGLCLNLSPTELLLIGT